jgi:hypothetical protein
VTIAPADKARFLGVRVVRRRLRAIVARFRRPAALKGTNRAEFEQMAQDFGLSHPELYGLLTGRNASAGLVEERLNKLDASSKRTTVPEPRCLPAEIRACLPIGPSCC